MMIMKVDSRRRVVLPTSARPGQIFSIMETGAGRYVLELLKKPATNQRWLVLTPYTTADLAKAYAAETEEDREQEGLLAQASCRPRPEDFE